MHLTLYSKLSFSDPDPEIQCTLKEMATLTKRARARLQYRDGNWPGVTYWPREKEDGWAKVPRSLPMVLAIVKQQEQSTGIDLTATYVCLLCHNMGDGLIEILDEDEMAALSGLTRKAWLLRMKALQEIGLIDYREKLGRKIGYVVMKHPVSVVYALRKAGKVRDELWHALRKRNTEMGTTPTPEEESELMAEMADEMAGYQSRAGLPPTPPPVAEKKSDPFKNLKKRRIPRG